MASHTNTNAVASNICCSADTADADEVDDTKPPTRESAVAVDWASDAARDKGCGADEDDDEPKSGDEEEDEEDDEDDDEENGLFLKIDMKPEFLRRNEAAVESGPLRLASFEAAAAAAAAMSDAHWRQCTAASGDGH